MAGCATSGNNAVRSQSLVNVTTGTLASSSSSIHALLPTLPNDLIPEILCKLPVKLLIQLKCVCKFWNTVISDPKFAKKHLHVSKIYLHHHHLIRRGTDSLLWESTMSSIFSEASTTSVVPQLQLIVPEAISNSLINNNMGGSLVSSCDGILLFKIDQESNLLWNPSIRKVKNLPPLSNTPERYIAPLTFGYDPFIENYKLFAVVGVRSPSAYKIEVSVYTLGTDSWRRIDDFPCKVHVDRQGMFVSGTVNWLTFDGVIVSLDLEKESYRTLSKPDFDLKEFPSSLGVLRDCLCIFSRGEFFDVWVMNEYGIKDSWTKLFSVACADYFYREVLYDFDDQMLLSALGELGAMGELGKQLVVYNSRNGTLKIPRIPTMNYFAISNVYVESLISPCS